MTEITQDATDKTEKEAESKSKRTKNKRAE